MDAHSILLDDRYRVPGVPAGREGMAWLRSHVVRFSEGEDHRRRRALVAQLLEDVDIAALARSGDHVATLADALGIPRTVSADVRTIAAHYQPHAGDDPAADRALERLIEACGGRRDERTANLIGLLVQACDATAAAIAGRTPPVPVTRRVAPDGTTVTVPLDGVPFGAGRHECPGRAHAEALVCGVGRFHALHVGPRPLVLPNAWDAASAALFVRAGFSAVGTTSLGVAAAAGVPDGSGLAAEDAMRLVDRLVRLPVPITVDIESGWGRDPAELAVELWERGVAGVNIEDGQGTELAPPEELAAAVTAMKDAAPSLFVNARTDTHWLGVDRDSTVDRVRRYVDAGADGVFVPGLEDDAGIASVAGAVDVPLNVLAHGDVTRLGDLGVRRISTGSLPYRAALRAAVDAVTSVRDGGSPPTALPYADVDGLSRLFGRHRALAR